MARLWDLAARSIRPVLVLAGLGVVAYLFYQVGPRAVWGSVQALGWKLPIVVAMT